MIAREERTHAEFSWAVVEWLVGSHRGVVADALAKADLELDAYPRPTAVSDDKRALVAAASEPALRRHGRLRMRGGPRFWDDRKAKTRTRLDALLAGRVAKAA